MSTIQKVSNANLERMVVEINSSRKFINTQFVNGKVEQRKS